MPTGVDSKVFKELFGDLRRSASIADFSVIRLIDEVIDDFVTDHHHLDRDAEAMAVAMLVQRLATVAADLARHRQRAAANSCRESNAKSVSVDCPTVPRRGSRA